MVQYYMLKKGSKEDVCDKFFVTAALQCGMYRVRCIAEYLWMVKEDMAVTKFLADFGSADFTN